MHHPCDPGEADSLAPCFNFSLKNEPWLIHSKLTGDLPLSRSQQNLQGTFPIPRGTYPEDGESLPPSPVEQCCLE